MIPLVTHPNYSFEFPRKHRFPMEKFRLLHDCLKQQGLANDRNCFRPGQAKLELLQLAHCNNYLERFIHNKQTKAELRRMGLPWSPALVKRTLISPNGTLLTARLALDKGIACHLAGGTHHASHNEASGFCILNDLAVASLGIIAHAKYKQHTPARILIFDCDVHQGDGTAKILAHESQAYTCSVHCDKNFPARKARSDLDVEVARGCGDDEYLERVDRALKLAIDNSKPNLIFYDAGVDIYDKDPLGLLNISLEGIRQRERCVLSTCRAKGIPVATVIGGGYDDDRKALAARHAIVVEEAFRVFNG